MANNLTLFSFKVDVPSKEIAEKIVADFRAGDPEGKPYEFDVIRDSGDAHVILAHCPISGTGNIDDAIQFTLDMAKKYEFGGEVRASWAQICDRPRVGEFGGGCCKLQLSGHRMTAVFDTFNAFREVPPDGEVV